MNLITSESVTEGHPDKVCDQISDAVLDNILEQDPFGRVACETMATNNVIVVAGEITTKAYVEVPNIVKKTLKNIGYDPESFGILTAIHAQSPDIAMGVDTGGAGDQGMMYGYACNETKELMPMPINLAHKLAMKMAEVRKGGGTPLLPDGKTQVTVAYENGKAVAIDTVLISTQHPEDITIPRLKQFLLEKVIKPVLDETSLFMSETTILVNPTGRFVTGGPKADTGLTGRKIIVDTYGGVGRHGGGAFSGKDATKVDRSAAYMARHIAKTLVANQLAERCEIQLAYAIGVAEPVSIYIDTFGTGNNFSDEKLVFIVKEQFDLRPKAIIDYLELRKPIFTQTASYGHFGRDIFSWEKARML